MSHVCLNLVEQGRKEDPAAEAAEEAEAAEAEAEAAEEEAEAEAEAAAEAAGVWDRMGPVSSQAATDHHDNHPHHRYHQHQGRLDRIASHYQVLV